MKKNLLITTALAEVISFYAFAKIEVNYVGLNLLYTNVEALDVDAADNTVKHDDSDFSLGVSYSHAFNFDGFFVAPELFYDYNNADVEARYADQSGGASKYTMDNSVGIKVNVGYDVSDEFAVYASIGRALVRTEVDSIPSTGDGKSNEEADIFGLGVKYNLNENLGLSLGHDILQADFTGFPNDNANYNTTKLGVSYKF
jgi:opacity protein-like surface antigen